MVLKHWGPRNHLIHKNKHFSFILLGIFLKIITFVIKNTFANCLLLKTNQCTQEAKEHELFFFI